MSYFNDLKFAISILSNPAEATKRQMPAERALLFYYEVGILPFFVSLVIASYSTNLQLPLPFSLFPFFVNSCSLVGTLIYNVVSLSLSFFIIIPLLIAIVSFLVYGVALSKGKRDASKSFAAAIYLSMPITLLFWLIALPVFFPIVLSAELLLFTWETIIGSYALANLYSDKKLSGYILFPMLLIGLMIGFAQLLLAPVFCPAQISACISGSGILCQGPVVLGTNGNLSFTFGQSTGSTYYNIALACTATASLTSGLPNPSNAMVYIEATGAASNTTSNHYNSIPKPLMLARGTSTRVTGLKCFSAGGYPLAAGSATVPVGTAFIGSLYMNFTPTPNTTPIVTQKVAAITVKVT